jgi:hypothetical protein
MTFARLFSPCLLFAHAERIRERDDQGRMVLVCPQCGDVQRQLETRIIIGPQHQPARVPGAPTGKAKIVVDDNVVPFERQSSR